MLHLTMEAAAACADESVIVEDHVRVAPGATVHAYFILRLPELFLEYLLVLLFKFLGSRHFLQRLVLLAALGRLSPFLEGRNLPVRFEARTT